MAAICASKAGARVTLCEQNEKLGKKIYITGKGRCNLTNTAEREAFFGEVVSNPKFLYSAFAGMDNFAVMELVEGLGCPLKEERGGRVFPVSDHASDVIAALRRGLEQAGVEVRLRTAVKKIVTGEADAAGLRHVTGVRLSTGEFLQADAVILCTGGLSYPTTGSTGDGLRFARELGHTITPLRPSLVAFRCKEPWCADLMGLSLKNISLRMIDGDLFCSASHELSYGKKQILYEGFGELLFTHFGVSGPLILSASAYYGRRKTENVAIILDLKPALTPEQLDKRLLREFEEHHAKQVKNILPALLPAKMVPIFERHMPLYRDKTCAEVTREERTHLRNLLKNFHLIVTGTGGYEEAVITQGGISVKEVDPKTMQSRLIPGLYFAGELLDLDALTGGYNLQIAWSTGALAGRSAAKAETAGD